MAGWGTAVTLLTAVWMAACQSSPPSDLGGTERPAAVIRDGGTERPAELIVGLAPFLPRPKLEQEYAPLVRYLGKTVGIPTRIKRADSYDDLSSLLAQHALHLAILPPLAYVRAKRDNPSLILLAAQIANGSLTYGSYIVIRDDSKIRTLADLKGKRIAFVDRTSSSGYLYPMLLFYEHGINPSEDFGATSMVGDHASVYDAVRTRSVDAGAIASPIYKMMRSDSTQKEQLRILAKAGRLPFDAYCASPRLAQSLVDELRAALLSLSTRTEEGRKILGGFTSINGFVEVTDEHYDDVRRHAQRFEELSSTAENKPGKGNP